MDPNNGDVLAMASNYPNFDLSNPDDVVCIRTVLQPRMQQLAAMDDDAKMDALNQLWQ